MKYKCPCCGYYTFDKLPGGTYDICPVCFWEDDGWQLANPDEGGGANKVSLNQAKLNYMEFGVCEPDKKEYVRAAAYKDTICADINELLKDRGRINNRKELSIIMNYPGLSIEAHLEVIVGGYFVQGSPDEFEYVYFPVNEDNLPEVLLYKDNMAAIISEKAGLAFVCDRIYEKFCDDTKDYKFSYIRIGSLLEENLMCEHPQQLPEEYKDILWIDDDFMNDDTIEFDYEAFEVIDSGADYLNPKHFSIYEFARRRNIHG